MHWFVLVFAVAAASCQQAAVIGASRDEIVIQHDPAFASAEDLQPKAEAECQKYGKHADFIGHEFPTPLWYRYARFACR